MLKASEYLRLYDSALLTTDIKQSLQIIQVCRRAVKFIGTYLEIQKLVRVPWPIVAAIHFRESSQDFTRHLHNGDPLGDFTIRVPRGRPENAGPPPFTWIESACDALSMRMRMPHDWDLASCLLYLEQYNGMGYQKRGLNTPYLWNYTQYYTKGLYVADGKFDPNIQEHRPGCVAILKTLQKNGVSLDFSQLSSDQAGAPN